MSGIVLSARFGWALSVCRRQMMKMEWEWGGLAKHREDFVYTRRTQCTQGKCSCTREGLCAYKKSLVYVGRCPLSMVHILCTRSWKCPGYSGSVRKSERVVTVSESLVRCEIAQGELHRNLIMGIWEVLALWIYSLLDLLC